MDRFNSGEFIGLGDFNDVFGYSNIQEYGDSVGNNKRMTEYISENGGLMVITKWWKRSDHYLKVIRRAKRTVQSCRDYSGKSLGRGKQKRGVIPLSYNYAAK